MVADLKGVQRQGYLCLESEADDCQFHFGVIYWECATL